MKNSSNHLPDNTDLTLVLNPSKSVKVKLNYNWLKRSVFTRLPAFNKYSKIRQIQKKNR